MREVAFIKQNKEKWLEYEQIIKTRTVKSPDDMAAMYIQLVNDLSFSRTFYPKSKTTKYINQLTSEVFQQIYRTKRQERNRILNFFFLEVPLLAYQYRKYIYRTFIAFFISFSIGVISAKYDTDFVRLIFGDAYVNSTLENIRNGNPTAVYASGSNWGSFIGITANNLFVGVKCYLFGISAGIMTAQIFLYNAIMIGSFQYFFYEQGVLYKSVQAIWIHGSMEIFGIIIQASCGFILGGSILFPGTYSRIESFVRTFKNTFYIFLATIPFMIFAGLLEGFVTRYANTLPAAINLSIIFTTLFFISFYFLILPLKVAKIVYRNSDIQIV